jgi:C4-dicarboxylate-specific signal transduction histidine kinase
MSWFNPLLWPKPPVMWRYGIAVLSVIAALAISRWPVLHLQEAPVSLFLCAVLLGAWFGGVGPALLVTALSSLAFSYYFHPPVPRLLIFLVSTVLVGLLGAAQRNDTESLRRARDDLKGTVQDLEKTNEALQMESIERKHAEEALRQAQGELARVSRVTTMGELTASLAHEVNQPIAAAVTNANSCIHWLAGDVPNIDKARAAAMRIVKDGTRAAEIISGIRLLFQKGTPQWQLVEINEIIGEMIEMLQGEATRHSISVRTELAPDLPRFMGDRVQLQQALMNLMTNSIDAMKAADGTRELVIQSQQGEDGQVLVSVSDTGVGLPPQQADQIFNAFFTTKPHGTGMGLRICRSIVESHGGRLWADNTDPRGARFSFTLSTKIEVKE